MNTTETSHFTYRQHGIRLCLLGLLLLQSLQSYADNTPTPAAQQNADNASPVAPASRIKSPLTPPPSFLYYLDVPNKTISDAVENIAKSIDEFFANEKVFYKTSGSFLRYSVNGLFQEGGRVTTVGNLNISLKLPRTEQKLRLVLDNNPIETQTNLERVTNNGAVSQQSDNNYYAGILGEFGKASRWQFKPSIGIKLHSPIEYYVSLRAYRNINFSKWNLHVSQSAYWFDSTGAGFDSEMQWNHLIDNNLLFRADSLVRHTQEYHRFDLSQVFSVTQTFSNRRAIVYSLGFFGNSAPKLHATDYIIQARYRQIIHGNYLFMELVPQVRYRSDYAFTQEDSLLIRFEWLFQKS